MSVKQTTFVTLIVPTEKWEDIKAMLGKKYPEVRLINEETRPTFNAGNPDENKLESGVSG